MLKNKKREYYELNKERIKESMRENYRLKSNIIKEKKRIEYQEGKEIIKERVKKYRELNKDLINETKRNNWKENKNNIKEYTYKINSNYIRNRKQIDPLFRLERSIRNLINVSIRNNGYTKKSRTHEILGCSYIEFKEHIEKQFVNGMCWENHGEWHYDHIIPMDSAIKEEDIINLNHYTNFKPLWAIDNLRKSNKII